MIELVLHERRQDQLMETLDIPVPQIKGTLWE